MRLGHTLSISQALLAGPNEFVRLGEGVAPDMGGKAHPADYLEIGSKPSPPHQWIGVHEMQICRCLGRINFFVANRLSQSWNSNAPSRWLIQFPEYFLLIFSNKFNAPRSPEYLTACLLNDNFSLSVLSCSFKIPTLLKTRTMEHVSSNAVGLSALDDQLPGKEKGTLLRCLRERKPETEMYLLSIHEYKSQPELVRKNRRLSKPHASRNDIDPERARKLERNCVAASKCRFKKKKEQLRLQSVLDGHFTKWKTLSAEANALREEVWHIKTQAFEHANLCEYQQISLKLAMLAQHKLLRVNSDAMKCPPTFSVRVWSDGPAGKGDLDDIQSDSLEDVADPARQDFPEDLFDTFIDGPCI